MGGWAWVCCKDAALCTERAGWLESEEKEAENCVVGVVVAAYLIDVAISNNHNLHRTITLKPRKYR